MTRVASVPASYRATIGLILLAVVVILWAVWASPAVFLHDYAEWLYQAKILAAKLASPEQVTAFKLHTYPVPNSLSLYVMALLHLVAPPFVTGKLYVTLYVAGWALVSRSFVRRFFADAGQQVLAWCFILSILCFSSFFYYGFTSYQLSLLLFLWFVTLFNRNMPLWQLALFGVGMFFSHAAILICWTLLLGVALILWRGPWQWLAATLPTGLLSLAYLIGRFGGGSGGIPPESAWANFTEAAVYKAGMVTMQGPFKNFILPAGDTLLEQAPIIYWLGVAANVGVIGIFGVVALWALWQTWTSRDSLARDSIDLPLLGFVLLAVVIYIIGPHHFFGLVHPGGRMVLPTVIAILALLSSSSIRLGLPLVAVAVTVTLSSALLYNRSVATVGSIAASIPVEAGSRPSAATRSVMAHNDWLYQNTRYKYYNYRVFLFPTRNEMLKDGSFSGISFKTGPISDTKVKNPP
jgi:hypothetical protein